VGYYDLDDELNIFKTGVYFKNSQKHVIKCSLTQLSKAIVILPDELTTITNSLRQNVSLREGTCKSVCCNCDSLQYAIDIKTQSPTNNVVVLNMANPFHPITNVRKKSCTQEENLCKRSSLLYSLNSREASKYYESNQKSENVNNNSTLIISPYVEVIKDRYGELYEDSVVVSVVTCAAPIADSAIRETKGYSDLFYKRIIDLLVCLAYYKYDYLVLGAWGCGAFGNDAKNIAALFKKAICEGAVNDIKLGKCFNRIDFAVFDNSFAKYNYNCFNCYFNDN